MESFAGRNDDNGITSGSDDSDVPTKRMQNGGSTLCEKSYDALVSGSDEDEDTVLSDEGDLSDDEVEVSFSIPYHLHAETSVSLSNLIVLHVCGTNGSNAKVAAALSDHTCSVYDVHTLSKVASMKGHKGTISNIRFNPTSNNLLYSSSTDGRLKLWDLRKENNCVKEFKDDTDGADRLKPLTSFDVSCNNRYLCAGTELIGGDAFLLYWDARTSALLGGYWESHTDDVTQVAFHPSKQNTVTTGSTDGLINIFDIGLESEDEALRHSLNTESSVGKLGWFSRGGIENGLSCITHTEHLQLWETEGAAPYLHLDREKLTQGLRRNPSDNGYLVGVHRLRDSEDLMVLGGSTAGSGQCLRTLRITDTTITPMSDLIGNRQVVRASWFDETNDVLVTGGESGFLSVWKAGKSPNVQVVHSEMKALSSVKNSLALHASRPY